MSLSQPLDLPSLPFLFPLTCFFFNPLYSAFSRLSYFPSPSLLSVSRPVSFSCSFFGSLHIHNYNTRTHFIPLVPVHSLIPQFISNSTPDHHPPNSPSQSHTLKLFSSYSPFGLLGITLFFVHVLVLILNGSQQPPVLRCPTFFHVRQLLPLPSFHFSIPVALSYLILLATSFCVQNIMAHSTASLFSRVAHKTLSLHHYQLTNSSIYTLSSSTVELAHSFAARTTSAIQALVNAQESNGYQDNTSFTRLPVSIQLNPFNLSDRPWP